MKPTQKENENAVNDFFSERLEARSLGDHARAELTFMRFEQALPFALELQSPPIALKQRIISAVRELEQSASLENRSVQEATSENFQPEVQLWKKWAPAPNAADLLVQRHDAGQWEKTGVEGVEVKQLFVDQKRDYVSMLVRMLPGASYPSHRHGGFEECYVLQGDLSIGEATLYAGDYQRAVGGSVHVVQSTSTGCLLFIVSSQHDELLA